MEAYSVGIIGGADGPTAILIAGPDIGWGFVAVAAAVVLAAAAGWLLIRKRRKNQAK
ncbi:MAG: LPXTG cell wall anchor domain-containing protein [Clostridia bacterium]|nr:LPXTG cell wall anchor domain-containing protein [Clostridia bacterium]